MLDAFTAVLSREADRKEAEDALTAEMMNLPISDLQKIASGTKLADLCSDDSKGTWLSKYEGTPLYDQALSLEEALIEVEAERVRRRMEEPKQEDLWAKEDLLRLKKRQLDLELVKSDQGKASQVNLDDRGNNEPAVAKTGSVDKYILPANGVADALVGYNLSRREGLSIPQSIGFGALDAALGTGELAMARKGLHEKTASADIDMAGRAMAHAMHKVAYRMVISPEDAAGMAADDHMPLYGDPHPSQMDAALQDAQGMLQGAHSSYARSLDKAKASPVGRYLGPTLVGGGLGSLAGAVAGGPSLKGLGIGAGIGGLLGAGVGALSVPSIASMQADLDLQGKHVERGSDPELMRALIQQQLAANRADYEHDRNLEVAREGATNVNVHNHSHGRHDDDYKYAHAAMAYAIKEAFGPAIAMGARAAAPAVANAARAALPAIGNAAKSVLGGGSGSFLSQVGNSLAVNKATEAVSNLMK